jgi:hypothetical protein
MTALLALSFTGVIWFAQRAEAPQPTSLDDKDVPVSVSEQVPVAVDPDPTPEAPVVPAKIPEDTPVSIAALSVPFTSQAPSAKWSDDTFQNGCEEASLVMAAYWISGKALTKEVAEKEIVALSTYERKSLGHAVDTSAADTAELFSDYYDIGTAEVRYDIAAADIRTALADDAIVIVPTNGQRLGNPNFKRPGPLTHMLVVIGYDAAKQEFITNDPGTRLGKGYRYDEKVLLGAIRDYPTGKHLPIAEERTAMIIVRKP